MGRSLDNYIRTFRRRSYLSQDEVAILLGGATGTTVLRHEADQRVPTLPMALTYAVILRADPRELFAGRYEAAEAAVLERARELLARSREELPTPEVAAKVAYLEDLVADPEPHAVPCEAS